MVKLSNTSYSKAHPKILIYQRKRIAQQIISCFKHIIPNLNLKSCVLLDVGCSNGAISYYLSQQCKKAIGIDTDRLAIKDGHQHFFSQNLTLQVFDGQNIPYFDNYFDLIVFRRTYGSVENLKPLVKAVFRVLKPSGLCYFEGHNKLFPFESDYKIPFLSWLPPQWAKMVVKLFSHQQFYIGHYQTLWGLQKLFKKFSITPLTYQIIKNPQKFHFTKLYNVSNLSKYIPPLVLRLCEPFFPDFIWILKKND